MLNNIVLHNVSCYRKNIHLFKNINFTINSGDIILVKGLNGVGKSTLLLYLAGILSNAYTEGNVYWNNTLLNNIHKWKLYQNRVSFIVNNFELFPNLTIFENLKYISILNGYSRNIEKSIDFSILWKFKNQLFKNLSVGQKQKLLLCQLLTTPRPIWVLDEPTLGLDYVFIQKFEWLINYHSMQGGITVISTHLELNLKYKILNLDI